jgi:conjugative transposon TraK protein
MFKKLKNIETAFQHVRAFTIAVVACAFLAVGFTVYQCRALISTIQSRVYILFNGKVLDAIAADRKDNVAVEARDHVKTFHQLFFTLSPDEKANQANLGKALYLADESAKREYDNLSESGYMPISFPVTSARLYRSIV